MLTLLSDQQVEEESDDTDGDSAQFSLGSATTSLADSIYKFRELHGRTFHREFGQAESWEPNDENHLNSMDALYATTPFPARLEVKAMQKLTTKSTAIIYSLCC